VPSSPSDRVAAAPRPSRNEADRDAATRNESTFGPQSLSNRPPRRLVALTTALTTGTLLVVVVALLAVRFRENSAPPVLTSASPRESTPENVGPALDPSSKPPALPTVRLTLQSSPPTVEAFLDGRSLGSAPGPLLLPHGDKPLTLRFTAPGYQPKSAEILPNADGTVSVTLSPVPPVHAHPKKAVDDLEF
jgi:hypothetical protein